jgi:hypothetical protein
MPRDGMIGKDRLVANRATGIHADLHQSCVSPKNHREDSHFNRDIHRSG